MTICIAAIGTEVNSEEFIVFTTDHMITTGIGQFEHSIAKYKKLDTNIVAMLAGQALLFDDLTVIDTSKELHYDEIKRQVFENFRRRRIEAIEKEIFGIYGINHEFFIESLQKQIPNLHIQTILDKIATFKLGTQILLVGFKDGKAMISEVHEAGAFDFRNINFHTIGSGSIQASNTLLFQKQSKSDNISTTIYNVYKAKRNAEVMQGVGKETDLLLLTQDDMKKIPDEKINILKNIYNKELEFGKNHSEIKSMVWY